MIQIEFAHKAAGILEQDENVIGLAVGGSWLTGQLDEFSDLDLILVTRERVSHDKSKMLAYAERLGNFLSGFTGEHVGEPRVLICLYDTPLMHVDIKFLTLEELEPRIEDPVILLDKAGQLRSVLEESIAAFPYPDYQWIEDRFWTWVHYALLKIGRGEYLEALDFTGFLRMVVFGPLLHIKSGNLPRGVRKVETELPKEDFLALQSTIPACNKVSLLAALRNAVDVYRHLRTALFDTKVVLKTDTENRVMQYFEEIDNRAAESA